MITHQSSDAAVSSLIDEIENEVNAEDADIDALIRGRVLTIVDRLREILLSAPAAAVGGEQLGDCQDKALAWDAICVALNTVLPGWARSNNMTGLESAVAAIHKMATAPAAPVGGFVVDEDVAYWEVIGTDGRPCYHPYKRKEDAQGIIDWHASNAKPEDLPEGINSGYELMTMRPLYRHPAPCVEGCVGVPRKPTDSAIEAICAATTTHDWPNAFQPSAKDWEGDWTEDFTHENGNYNNTCHQCQRVFVGHKRRITCKLCSAKDGVRGIPMGGQNFVHNEKKILDAINTHEFAKEVVAESFSGLTPREATTAASLVDDAMVERACAAAVSAFGPLTDSEKRNWRDYMGEITADDLPECMRAALEAAIGREVEE